MAFGYGGALSRSMKSAFRLSPSPIRALGSRSSSSATNASSSAARAPLPPSSSPCPASRQKPLGNDNASIRRRSASPSTPLSRLSAELGGVMSMLPPVADTLTSPFCLNYRSCSALSQGDIGGGDGG